jgi:ATP phosphoribosyltransferase
MPRVATKYVHLTQQYYATLGQQVEIIKLYGSMELAPLVGLADYIVDLVSTGATLRANGLIPLTLIFDVSARLIVNKAAFKLHTPRIRDLITRLETAVNTLYPLESA